ncbi:uncharacterized protein CEXT_373911 [Caerostris extrusa]|uniref:WAP domain-containing protein n=1 Tax=Caerostris extrusa TaxID=172846 RepID=A0AAV4UY40_CAEEX|nr:uncharacterized protein CEXT_373911 [Caerostris extrusa]
MSSLHYTLNRYFNERNRNENVNSFRIIKGIVNLHLCYKVVQRITKEHVQQVWQLQTSVYKSHPKVVDEVHETILIGLSCPRFDPDMDRVCGESPPALSSSVPPVVTDEDINKPDCDEETTKKPEVTTKSSALESISTPISEISLMRNKTWRELLKNDEDMRIFLYSIIQPQRKTQDKKNKREVPDELEEGTCRWNGDCPCPLICCRAGEGCPRRCKMGIRLPPPWGK